MKLIWVLILAAMVVNQDVKKKVIFFGDSITEAGVKPGGYVLKVVDLAARENKASQYDFIGSGIGGNKVYDLYLRLEDDVLSKNPDVVVIYIGVKRCMAQAIARHRHRL